MRAMVVNAAQLATYSQAKQFLLSTREGIYTVHTILVHILYTACVYAYTLHTIFVYYTLLYVCVCVGYIEV